MKFSQPSHPGQGILLHQSKIKSHYSSLPIPPFKLQMAVGNPGPQLHYYCPFYHSCYQNQNCYLFFWKGHFFFDMKNHEERTNSDFLPPFSFQPETQFVVQKTDAFNIGHSVAATAVKSEEKSDEISSIPWLHEVRFHDWASNFFKLLPAIWFQHLQVQFGSIHRDTREHDSTFFWAKTKSETVLF